MKRPHGDETLDRARDLRRLSTDAERTLWRELRNRRLSGHKFRRQVWLGPFIADLVCLEARLVIEADGAQHADAVDYDDQRSAWLAREGFAVLRFWNVDVLTNIRGVIATIYAALPSPSHAQERAGPSLSPSGRGERDAA